MPSSYHTLLELEAFELRQGKLSNICFFLYKSFLLLSVIMCTYSVVNCYLLNPNWCLGITHFLSNIGFIKCIDFTFPFLGRFLVILLLLGQNQKHFLINSIPLAISCVTRAVSSPSFVAKSNSTSGLIFLG